MTTAIAQLRCTYASECPEPQNAEVDFNYGLCTYHYQRLRVILKMGTDPKVAEPAPIPARFAPREPCAGRPAYAMHIDEYEKIATALHHHPNVWHTVDVREAFSKKWLDARGRPEQFLTRAAQLLYKKLHRDPQVREGKISYRCDLPSVTFKIMLITNKEKK